MGDFQQSQDVLAGMFSKYPRFKEMLEQAPEVDPEEDRRIELEEWEAEQRAKRREQFKRMSHIPPAFENMTFGSFDFDNADAGEACNEVEDWVDAWPDQTPRGLLLWGDPGVGKTHLAVAAMSALMEKGAPCMFSTVPELLEAMRDEYRVPGDGGYIDLVKHVDVLLLDDLGTENLTEWAQERMFIIINSRYINDLPTIITTNLQPYDLQFKVGGRIFSRIMGMTAQIEVRGEDYRLKRR